MMNTTQDKTTKVSAPETRKTLNTDTKLGNCGGWQDRHNHAVNHPGVGFERAIRDMLNAWQEYAHTHKRRYESKIGDDYVLGPEWQQIGEGIRGLLNGECGKFDCGTLDAFILYTLKDNGINTDTL
jgi:hypothetical protein